MTKGALCEGRIRVYMAGARSGPELDRIYVITCGAALPVGSAVQAPEPGADIPSETVGFEILCW